MNEILQQHQTFLRGLARRLCRSRFDAEDLVQDVVERAILSMDRLPPGANHRAWLGRIMHNLFIDRVRHLAAKPEATAVGHCDDFEAVVADEAVWWSTLDADDVRARLGELPLELRGAFELFAFEGCSYQEIAARLSIPKTTVGTRILRARRRLRQLLQRHAAAMPGVRASLTTS